MFRGTVENYCGAEITVVYVRSFTFVQLTDQLRTASPLFQLLTTKMVFEMLLNLCFANTRTAELVRFSTPVRGTCTVIGILFAACSGQQRQQIFTVKYKISRNLSSSSQGRHFNIMQQSCVSYTSNEWYFLLTYNY